jgi:hypothetical protein
MYHVIEFADNAVLDLEVSAKQPLERIRVKRGDRVKAQIRPYVAETEEGFVEMADLFFADGTATRGVPWSAIFFVE